MTVLVLIMQQHEYNPQLNAHNSNKEGTLSYNINTTQEHVPSKNKLSWEFTLHSYSVLERNCKKGIQKGWEEDPF